MAELESRPDRARRGNGVRRRPNGRLHGEKLEKVFRENATSFQIPTRLPLWRVFQATTPSIMSLETQSMASGSSARKRRKTVLATTRSGLRRLGSVHE